MLKKLITMLQTAPRKPVLYRHGDVLLAKIDALPENAEPIVGLVLARGEATGHAHRIAEEDGRATLLRTYSEMLLQIRELATLVHEEHGPIVLEPGVYRVWKQREYVPAGKSGRVTFRPVSD